MGGGGGGAGRGQKKREASEPCEGLTRFSDFSLFSASSYVLSAEHSPLTCTPFPSLSFPISSLYPSILFHFCFHVIDTHMILFKT